MRRLLFTVLATATLLTFASWDFAFDRSEAGAAEVPASCTRLVAGEVMTITGRARAPRKGFDGNHYMAVDVDRPCNPDRNQDGEVTVDNGKKPFSDCRANDRVKATGTVRVSLADEDDPYDDPNLRFVYLKATSVTCRR